MASLRFSVPGQVAHAWETLRGSLWFIPGVMALGAVLLALAMLRIDDWWAASWAVESGWIYSRSAGGARDLLSTVASSMITIAGLTFSILVVALQLASSQFGPRVLRNYLRDRGSQFVLGTFIATFLYCLMVMRTISGIDGDEPRLAVTVAVVLAVASLAVLIYFLHHSAASIHAPNVIGAAADELHRALERLYPENAGEPPARADADASSGPPTFVAVTAPRDGYVQRVDGRALLRAADDAGVLVYVIRRPGDFVYKADPLLATASPHGLAPRQVRLARAAFIIGGHRTAEQDIEFCFEQLIQIALRALSPAYNDPLTAAACIARIGAGFNELLQRREPSAVRATSDGCPRVFAPPVAFAKLVDLVFTPLIQPARGSSVVFKELTRTLESITPRVSTDTVRTAFTTVVRDLEHQLDSLRSADTREDLRARCRSMLAALDTTEPASL